MTELVPLCMLQSAAHVKKSLSAVAPPMRVYSWRRPSFSGLWFTISEPKLVADSGISTCDMCCLLTTKVSKVSTTEVRLQGPVVWKRGASIQKYT